jgi:shikimate dehydrogenase
MSEAPGFKQELTAVFGHPVAENPTQVMMEAAYRQLGLTWRYLTIEVTAEGLPDAVRGARAMGFVGFNCTIPHKVAVVPLLDAVGQSATMIGAVNCVVRNGARFVGENTDGKGFLTSLRGILDPRGRRVVLFGAGGAARAICVELALAGAQRITVVNRTRERGAALVSLLKEKAGLADAQLVPWNGRYPIPADTDILINATSIGLYPKGEAELDVEFSTLTSSMVVADVIPNPPRTHLLKTAAQRGCRTIDGLGMLVNQGVIGFRLWTGKEPDAKVMRAALEKVFGA